MCCRRRRGWAPLMVAANRLNAERKLSARAAGGVLEKLKKT
jgi:hypothetical protein